MATLTDVAEAAGVSPATASKVLTGRVDRIPEATAERVRQAAGRLGYRGNAMARAVRSGRCGCVGMIGNVLQQVDRFDPFWPRVQMGVERGLRARGLDLLLLGGAGLGEACARAATALAEHRIDGLILPSLPGMAWSHSGPAVSIGEGAFTGMAGVHLDPRPGLAAAVARVRERGAQRLLIITSSIDGRTQQPERAEILSDLGLPSRRIDIPRPWPVGITETPAAIAASMRILAPLLTDIGDGTAICAANDLLGIACLRLLRDRVPHAVQIVGFDDIQAECSDPPLSSVSHELIAMGRVAADLIADILAGAPAIDRLVLARFVPRGST